MTIDQALLVLEQYQQVAGLDELTAMERLIRDYRTLPVEQRLAVNVFMAATKEPA
jgi:hypothetical protein